jgi:hypothetical protein
MTAPDERRQLRYVLAGVSALDVVELANSCHRSHASAGREGGHPLALLLASTPCLLVLAGIALCALLLFARRRSSLVTGLAAVMVLAILEKTSATLAVAGHSRNYFAGGASLAGWLFGLAFARRMDRKGDESLAAAGAVAGLAATYVDAGLSKVFRSGVLWADAGARVAVLSNHPIDDTSMLGAYARFVAENGGAARALSIATLVIELGAFLCLFGPRLRMVWGTLLLAFHVNVALATQTIFYVQASILLVAFSYPWGGGTAMASALPDPGQTRASAAYAGAWVTAAVAVAWLARAAGAFGNSAP